MLRPVGDSWSRLIEILVQFVEKAHALSGSSWLLSLVRLGSYGRATSRSIGPPYPVEPDVVSLVEPDVVLVSRLTWSRGLQTEWAGGGVVL